MEYKTILEPAMDFKSEKAWRCRQHILAIGHYLPSVFHSMLTHDWEGYHLFYSVVDMRVCIWSDVKIYGVGVKIQAS